MVRFMATEGEDGTLTHHEPLEDPASEAEAAHIYVILECDRPFDPSASSSLARVTTALLGRARGADLQAERAGDRLALRIPDRWMSSSHAELSRDGPRWVLADLASKNGCILNGEPSQQATLRDGDVFELGHTVFLFRESVAASLDGRLDLDCNRLAARAPLRELRTFVPTLARRFEALAQVARSQVPVVVTGETGTGKEVLAQALHRLSGRKGQFVAVNCGALPPSLVETELFGCKKGAFSGASADRVGLVRSADGGTLFLDEIGDLPEPAQAALLRVLEAREVLPVGADRPIKIDLRVVSATHRDLDGMVARGGFRADLLGRLSGFHIELPPLRDRREDLGILTRALLRRAGAPEDVAFSCKAARALLRYAWPSNIRELEKCLSSAVVLAQGDPTIIDIQHLPEGVRASLNRLRPPIPDLPPEDAERRVKLAALLLQHRGNIAAVARAMGKAPMQVHRWIKRYELEPELDAHRRRCQT
jgi:sigma-54 dependent transcriptional regulator, acetoin dehydrogenase operon transcriptional activator AcoR